MDKLTPLERELLEALEEQVAECFCDDCEICRRHEVLIAKARTGNPT